MRSSLVLVDGSSYFFRAFHALPPLTNSRGQPTGAMYGVANMVKRLIKDHPAERMAVVFDAKGKTFRDALYPQYKANRPPMPEALASQFEPLVEILQAMGVPLLIIEGVEADDVIGTLCQQARQQGETVLVSTGDKDMAQLVCEQVSLINTMTNTRYDPLAVEEKFKVKPHQMIDYLTLVGDSVDNIPGVPKCGPKTAAKWLQEYETLDNLLCHADAISGKVGEYLRASREQLPLSKQLVTIKTDVKLPLSIDDLKPQAADRPRLTELCKTYEFKSWLKELLQQAEEEPTADPAARQQASSYVTIQDEATFHEWLAALRAAELFCFDTETTSLQALDAELVGIALAVTPGQAAYIPLAHLEEAPQLSRDWVLAQLQPLLEDSQRKKVGQNLKYDRNVLRKYGICLQGIAYDTMLESYVLDSTASRHDMDSLALKYLGYKTISFQDVAGKGAQQKLFNEIAIAQAARYAAEDADITLQLHHTLFPRLEASLLRVFEEIEMPLVAVLAEIEALGVNIDLAELAKQGKILKQRIAGLEEEAIALAGQSFNLNSTKQLREILFEQQKLPIISKTPTGQASTAEPVLQELAYEYRLPAVIVEHRSLSKLVSTYIDALPKRVNAQTQRVHTSYNQAVTATGRLSSTEPNLQNIPIRSEEGRQIRRAFVAAEGYLLLAADYSQIELRIMAHLSQDEGLLAAFSQGLDIHQATAAEIFQSEVNAVTPEQRRAAKAVNFGLIYGMSAFGLAKQLGIDRQSAQQYMDTYFRRYPGVLRYMEDTRQQAHQQGYVETMFGRRLYLPEINSRNLMRKKAAERTAINAPMQGTAADIIKKAMLDIAQWQRSQAEPMARMIMQVHDELVFEVREGQQEAARAIIKEKMEHAVALAVPLQVSLGIGRNWGDAH
ncbi:MAG: DNA polymerase I [Legionellaceae bacterium]|nr:DNA polymerase I [Legionellaceae bacterium]